MPIVRVVKPGFPNTRVAKTYIVIVHDECVLDTLLDACSCDVLLKHEAKLDPGNTHKKQNSEVIVFPKQASFFSHMLGCSTKMLSRDEESSFADSAPSGGS